MKSILKSVRVIKKMKYLVFTHSIENINIMRKKTYLLTTLCFLLLTLIANAQTPPNAFNYSAVANNTAGLPIASTTIGIQTTILKSSPTGVSQYSENHIVNTDNYGVFNLVIGAGAVQNGSMATIDWSNDNYFLKVAMDAAGGTNFTNMGTTQLVSVPYALYAKSTGSLIGGIIEADPIFSASMASGITNADTTSWNNKQNQLIAGSNITISGDTISALVSNTNCFTHYIGEEFGGGVIYHLSKDSLGVEHGLIIDKTNLTNVGSWSNVLTAIGVSAESKWDGLSNCNAIIAQAGHTNSAAALCLNSTNGGQSDWYLPSIHELILLTYNYYQVSVSLSQIPGATAIPTGSGYWSSTEVNGAALGFVFGYWDMIYPTNKQSTENVRAIRSF
jgi:hypothetical protein